MKVQIGNVLYNVRWEHYPNAMGNNKGFTMCLISRQRGEGFDTVAVKHTYNKGTDQFSKVVGRRASLDAALRFGYPFSRTERKAFWDAFKASGIRFV